MIIVFGSINNDMAIGLNTLPEAGETVIAHNYEISPGGKGANQALAALRIGPRTVLVGAAGDDDAGRRMVTNLRRAGITTSAVIQPPELQTGCAVVMREASGENRIIVIPGANHAAAADQIPDEILKPDTYILMQMELRPEENWNLVRRAAEHGSKTILNLAPVLPVPDDIYALLDYVIMNEQEAKQAPPQKGKAVRIVTMAEKGAVAIMPDRSTITVPSLPVDVVDTTGAGDAWCGTFTACLHEGKKLEDAMRYASVAAALSCRKKGTQDSYVYLGEIEENLPNLT